MKTGTGHFSTKTGLSIVQCAMMLSFAVFATYSHAAFRQLSGSSVGNETWHEGMTYFISSDYTIQSGHQLVIEPGAIVKLNSGTKLIVASGASLMAEGEPWHYVVFTSADDSAVGHALQSSQYTSGAGRGIKFLSGASSTSAIRYCHFNNIHVPLHVAGSMSWSSYFANSNAKPKICDNIFRLPYVLYPTEAAALLIEVSSGQQADIDFFNCLVAGQSGEWGNGILTRGASGQIRLACYNSTFDTVFYGIETEYSSSANHTYYVKNNVFRTYDWAMTGGSGAGIFDYNGLFEFPEYASQVTYGDHNIQETDAAVDPFEYSEQNGFASHYTAKFSHLSSGVPNYNGSLIDVGEPFTAYPGCYASELQDKTIVRPLKLNSSNINSQSTSDDGGRFRALAGTSLDLGTVFCDRNQSGFQNYCDIGFHYDPAAACIYSASAINLTSLLTVPAGAALISATRIDVNNGGALRCLGTRSGTTIKPVNIVSFRSGGHITPKYDFAESFAQIMSSAADDSAFTFCAFSHIDSAVIAAKPVVIENCSFAHCSGPGAIKINDSKHVSIRNCLFTAEPAGDYSLNSVAIKGEVGTAQTACLVGNSIVGLDTAVHLNNLSTFDIVAESNIFADLSKIVNDQQTFSARIAQRNNSVWNNIQLAVNNTVGFGSESTNIQLNPCFAHSSLSEQALRATTGSSNGYFLSQSAGSASKRPFWVRPNQRLAATNGIEFDGISGGGYGLAVGCSSHLPTDLDVTGSGLYGDNFLGSMEFYGSGSGMYSRGSQTTPGCLWLFIGDFYASAFNFYGSDNARIRLNFENGSSLDVYLPTFETDYLGGIFLWVAADGSTYWANAAKSGAWFSDGFIPGLVDRDARTAIAHTSSNLAKSSFDAKYARTSGSSAAKQAAAQSPALNKGSQDYLSDGWTNLAMSNATRDNPGTATSGEALAGIPDKVASSSNSEVYDLLSQSNLDIGYHYCGNLRRPLQRVKSASLVYTSDLDCDLNWDDLTYSVTPVRPHGTVGENYVEYDVAFPADVCYSKPANSTDLRTLNVFGTEVFYAGWSAQGSAVTGDIAVLSDVWKGGANSVVPVHVATRWEGNPLFTPEDPLIMAVEFTAVDTISIPGPNGRINAYAACLFRWTGDGGISGSALRVFRYNHSLNTWEWIAYLHSSDNSDMASVRLAGTHNNGDRLWVLWSDYANEKFYGDCVLSADTASVGTNPYNDLPNGLAPPFDPSTGLPIPMVTGVTRNANRALDAVYDDRSSQLRIVYSKYASTTGYFEIRSARASLDGNFRPTGISQDIRISAYNNTERRGPVLARNYTSLFANPSEYMTIAYYENTPIVKSSTLTISNGTDAWSSPVTFQPVFSPGTPYVHMYNYPQVTSGVFGTARLSLSENATRIALAEELIYTDSCTEIISRIQANPSDLRHAAIGVIGGYCTSGYFNADLTMVGP